MRVLRVGSLSRGSVRRRGRPSAAALAAPRAGARGPMRAAVLIMSSSLGVEAAAAHLRRSSACAAQHGKSRSQAPPTLRRWFRCGRFCPVGGGGRDHGVARSGGDRRATAPQRASGRRQRQQRATPPLEARAPQLRECSSEQSLHLTFRISCLMGCLRAGHRRCPGAMSPPSARIVSSRFLRVQPANGWRVGPPRLGPVTWTRSHFDASAPQPGRKACAFTMRG